MERIGSHSGTNAGHTRPLHIYALLNLIPGSRRKVLAYRCPHLFPAVGMTFFRAFKCFPFNMYLNGEQTPPVEYSCASR